MDQLAAHSRIVRRLGLERRSYSRDPWPASVRRLAIPEAGRNVVVNQPCRLHERVADHRADEAKTPPLEVLAHRLRLLSLRRQITQLLPVTDDRGTVPCSGRPTRQAARSAP